jgi:hypothetical protein
MVLVDSTAPASAANPPTASPGHGGSNADLSRVAALVSAAARLGLGRLYARFAVASLPPRSREAVRASDATPARSTRTSRRRPRRSKRPPWMTWPTGPGRPDRRQRTCCRLVHGAEPPGRLVDQPRPPRHRRRHPQSADRKPGRRRRHHPSDPRRRRIGPQPKAPGQVTRSLPRALGRTPRPGVGGLDDAGDCRASDEARSWPGTSAE